MNDNEVIGYWIKLKTRCDRCHRAVNNIYSVMSGPCTGKFCGRYCYEVAKEEITDDQRQTDSQ